ncbi:MAG: NAD-dependent succinate-semialdehyde dehydrogenase [Candidatus Kapabacteria bacterium]|nr:NAD-dependent succinate-semialdehyde dehydrogenase [Candidatus Kapabacteria bacterium]
MSHFTTINPATEAEIATYAWHGHHDVDRMIAAAAAAQRAWSTMPLERRLDALRTLGAVLSSHVDLAAHTITTEMGKPLSQARAEVEKCVTACDYYVQHAIEILAEQKVPTDYRRSAVRFEPLGVILSIMPWNFPLWQFFRFVVPALAAGNGVLLKHAPSTTGSALLATRLCHIAGIPEELVQTLIIDIPDVERVIADRRIRAVTFTGSTGGGAAVASLAGSYVKKCVLELGGSDAYIVCADADVAHAASQCVASRCINSGQSCIAAKRFIVDASIAEAFTEAVIGAMAAQTVGDPMLPDTTIGPMARLDLRDALIDQVHRSVAAGAQLAFPRDPLDHGQHRGWFIAPSVLAHVAGNHPAATEEIFGPVAAIMTASSDTEAITLANASRYGLGAAVFTSDPERAEHLVAQLDAGNVFVNGYVRSDARMPFGGVKDSGYGRELGPFGLREFVNVKSVITI